MHLFVILQFYSILCILIRCEAPRTILDVALYQIKYIIIIKSNKLLLSHAFQFTYGSGIHGPYVIQTHIV